MSTMSPRTTVDALIQEAMLASVADAKTAGIKKQASAAEMPEATTAPLTTKVAMALADACAYAADELRKEAEGHSPEVSAAANKPVNNELGHAVKFPMPKGGLAGNVPSSATISGGAPTLAMVDQKSAKTAFAVTDAGHKLDAKDYRLRQAYFEGMRDAEQEYSKENPGMSLFVRGPGQDVLHRALGRHMSYAAAKHEKGENAYNPFGGLQTPTAGEKAKQKKQAAIQDPRVTDVTGAPPMKAEGATHLVVSNQAAINAKVREAAAPDKQDMKAYLKTPMQSAAQDPVLKNQVQHTDEAGAKVASLKKTAAEVAETQATDDTIKTSAARALLANLTAQVRAGSAS